jgi:glutathione synthase/RimK-type ligase-like ATP-grasp enzyme
MPERLVIVDKVGDWKPHFPELKTATARDYITSPEFANRRGLHVINLCRSYRYLSLGYYCSILAEARGHRVLPTTRTVSDLSRKSIYSMDFQELEGTVSSRLRHVESASAASLEVDVFFGQCSDPALAELARRLFDSFRVPLMRAQFKLQGRWRLDTVRPLYLHALNGDQERAFVSSLEQHLSRRWREPRAKRQYRYDIAILHNPDESLPPSDTAALKEFVKAGNRLGVNIDLIHKSDYGRVAEYDALFIRETTEINHYTYRFATKAAWEGMPVIDHPDSILRCTNKVYLAELLRKHSIPTPRTVVFHKENVDKVLDELPLPVVLKVPDSSFCRGVFRADTDADFHRVAQELLRASDLILAQEYVYTPFDWRIGVLSRQPLFACQYFMSDHHWQVIRHGAKGGYKEGGWKTLAVEDVARPIIDTALAAANLIGDGLYGVDIKELDGRTFVIEVNENPNIEATVEDGVLGPKLYEIIIEDLIRRVEQRRQG